MKKLSIGLVLIVASIGTSALAADMRVPVKAAPIVPPPAIYNWSGIYIGANIGWVGEHETWTYSNPVPATPPTSSAHDINLDDVIFGGHLGVQYQFNRVLVGVEGAVSQPGGSKYGASGLQCVSTVGSLCEAQAGTLWTVGGRLGWAMNRWLAFVNGGWARLQVSTRELTAPPTVFDTTGANQNGFYIGGGVEYALTDNLILGLEYQHVDVGSAYHASSADAFGPSPPASMVATSMPAKTSSARASA
jgi:outer membrane immunogenic protein